VAHYERFTDILCAAAKNGCDDKLEQEFRSIRNWFSREYFRVSKRLMSKIDCLTAVSFAHNCNNEFHSTKWLKTTAFLDLVLSGRSLRELLESDNGELISQVSLMSEAIYRYDRDFA
jgi:uncharacterized protein YfaT (DUF1175 family)